MLEQLLAIPLLPLLYYQGKKLKSTIPKLPEPSGIRQGVTGEGKTLRLLVIGDSAAAGVGVATVEQSLVGNLIQHLQEDYTVYWQLHAKSGAKTDDALQSLDALGEQQFDLIITSLGVNDMTHGASIKAWLAGMSIFIEQLRQRFQPQLIITSSLPPIGKFPAIPFPLNWFLGRRAAGFNSGLKTAFVDDEYIEYLSLALDSNNQQHMPEDYLASDGFHPGAKVYQLWAAEAVNMLQRSTHFLRGEDYV